MSDIISSVKSKQREIKKFQTEQAEQKGSKEQILKQLQENFDVTSLKDGEQILEEFKQERDKNENLLTKMDVELGEIIDSAKNKSGDESCSDERDS